MYVTISPSRREAARCFDRLYSFNSIIRRAQVPLQMCRCIQINSVLFSIFVVVVQLHADCDTYTMRGGVCGKLH